MTKKKMGRPRNEVAYTRKTIIIPDDVLREVERLAKANGSSVHAEMLAGVRDRVNMPS